MKIKELEKETNIPRATIRYYEKEGLINPIRTGNNYKDYSTEDKERLLKIVVLRKCDIPIEDIKNLFHQECSLDTILSKQKQELTNKINQLQGAIELCDSMLESHETMENFDGAYYMNLIETKEKEGKNFINVFIKDLIDYESFIFNEFFNMDYAPISRYRFLYPILLVIAFVLCVILISKDKISEPIKFLVEMYIFTNIIYLPYFFLKKKVPNIKKIIDNVLTVIGVLIILFVVIMYFID